MANTLDDLIRYQGGELARRFLISEQDSIYVNGALYQLASDLGIEETAKGFIDGSMSSEEGVKVAVGTYAEKYQKVLGEASMDELLKHYNSIIGDYLDQEELKKVNYQFEKFSKEKYENIVKDFGSAKYALDGEKKGVYKFSSEEEKEKAKNSIKKNKDLIGLVSILDDIKFEKLRPSSTKRSQRRGLKNFVEKL